MTECPVRKLMKTLCNEDCPEWGTCPISQMMLRKAIDLFTSYDPKPKETSG